MKRRFGSSGAVTLEKSNLDMDTSQKQQSMSAPEIEAGGGHGYPPNNTINGGGNGGSGDDDDYWHDFDDDDDKEENGGLFRIRNLFEELFDRKYLNAVLNEWQKTVMDLPAGIKQAYDMGLLSSAQLVLFLANDARPTIVRAITRLLPQDISRAFIGRMLADPAFLHEMILEQVATVGFSVWWEVQTRKDRLKQEWDLALLKVLSVSACNAFMAAETGTVAVSIEAILGALSKFLAKKKQKRLSVAFPSVSTNAFFYGAFVGIYSNLRYQLVNGLDKALINHFDVMGVALVLTTALRIMNVQLGEMSRVEDPVIKSDDLLKAYHRPEETSSSNWYISKNAIISFGLGLFRFNKGNDENSDVQEEVLTRKLPRKRIVRKKVAVKSL